MLPFTLPQVGPTSDETIRSFQALSQSVEKASMMAGDVIVLKKSLAPMGKQK